MDHQSINLDSITTSDIEHLRPPRNDVDPWKPYHWLVEPEFSRAKQLEDVTTVFLTNRECPFRCLMCDLWKNTLTKPTPRGAIPAQIRFALAQLPPAAHIKLYNSGNFFDRAAIPSDDYAEIISLVSGFKTVIVENHPKLCGPVCLEFRDRLEGAELEIALGLETIHEPTLAQLNKQMTVDDFRRAAEYLRSAGIYVRAFVLLRPPGMTEVEGIERALESISFAFDVGADVVSVIPTRGGNGIMERLAEAGAFHPPNLRSLERVLEVALSWCRGRVFADVWDVNSISHCTNCVSMRKDRLHQMNITQQVPPHVSCEMCCL
ncbi:MAG: radical SAM protein [Planctomycetota bacterium]|nr:radical SAM protein [Planctomycetota bacterium]